MPPKIKAEVSPAHISPENVNQNNLLNFCEQRFSAEEFKKIEMAYEAAYTAHEGISRDIGGEYVWHPINIAVILIKELGERDCRSIVAALLHDVVEDTEYFHTHSDPDNKKVIDALADIDKQFGDEDITDMVMALIQSEIKDLKGKFTSFL